MSIRHNSVWVWILCLTQIACYSTKPSQAVSTALFDVRAHTPPHAPRIDDSYHEVVERFPKTLEKLKAQGIVMLSNQKHMRFVLPTDAIFYTKSANLRKHSSTTLLTLLTILKCQHCRTLRIAGFTDGKRNETYTQILSQQRANRLKQFFMHHGVKGENILSIGYGQQVPLASNRTNQGRYLNRRIEITVLG